MIKPVAYLAKNRLDKTVQASMYKMDSNIFENIPLYTKEQPQPKIQMTQVEFDEFYKARIKYDNPHRFLNDLDLDTIRDSFPNLFKWIYKYGHGKDLECSLLFYKLWVDYELEKRDGAIEIVPDMKWFVRSKEKDDGEYIYIKNSKESSILPWYTVYKDNARYFDTEDEANLWSNPQMDVVQLSVEDK